MWPASTDPECDGGPSHLGTEYRVPGTQRFKFHNRYQDERIRLNVDRRRHGTATFFLPVLEDANSIQMSLMQIMRLLLTGQIEHKTASLLLYALQTASTNLRQTNFKPFVHEVILDPRDAAASLLDETHLWEDEDFEEEEEEVDEVEAEIEQKAEEAAEKARHVARWEARKEIAARDRGRKRYEEEEKLKDWVQQHPEYMLVRRNGRLTTERRPKEAAPAVPTPPAVDKKQVANSSQSSASKEPNSKEPTSTDKVRAQITNMIRENLPELTKVYNEAMKKKEETQWRKKPSATETAESRAQEKSYVARPGAICPGVAISFLTTIPRRR